jgi:predicted choloylglycine hydrolase
MLWIETKGTWREMGRQIGEQFRGQLTQCLDKFAPWLVADLPAHLAAIEEIRTTLRPHAPELLDETAGMAQSSGINEPLLLGYRFFNEVKQRMAKGCSVIFLAKANEGPLLGRNCDLHPGFEADIQLCRTSRPKHGPATITVTYLGMGTGQGLNEFGLGLGGASAQTEARFGSHGLPGGLLQHLVLQRCRNLPQATRRLAEHSFLGKPSNVIIADAQGRSALFEFAPGRPAHAVRRPQRQTWQACTNFFVSGHTPIKPQPPSLQSAYARYGRTVHQLGGGLVEHSLAGLQRLLREIAHPGLCIAEGTTLNTAYSHVLNLHERRMWISPGHPVKTDYQKVSL